MKRTVCALLIPLPLILVLAIVGQAWVGDFVATQKTHTEHLLNAVELGDWAKADVQYQTIAKDFQKTKESLQLWVDHQDVDLVSQHMLDLQVAVKVGDTLAAQRAAVQLLEAFDHLWHRGALTWGNLL